MDHEAMMDGGVTGTVRDRFRQGVEFTDPGVALEQVLVTWREARAERAFAVDAGQEAHGTHLWRRFRERQPELHLARAVGAVLGGVLMVGCPRAASGLADEVIDAVADGDVDAAEPL